MTDTRTLVCDRVAIRQRTLANWRLRRLLLDLGLNPDDPETWRQALLGQIDGAKARRRRQRERR